MFIRLVRRQHVIIGGDDADMGLSSIQQISLIINRTGGGMGKIGTAKHAAIAVRVGFHAGNAIKVIATGCLAALFDLCDHLGNNHVQFSHGHTLSAKICVPSCSSNRDIGRSVSLRAVDRSACFSAPTTRSIRHGIARIMARFIVMRGCFGMPCGGVLMIAGGAPGANACD